MLSFPLKPKSGTFVPGVTGKSSCKSIPLAPREVLPLLPSHVERVTLGPNATSLISVGVIVLTRFRDRFQEGFLAMQPPGYCSCPIQVKFQVCIGLRNSVAFLIQRPKMRCFMLIW